MSPVFAYVWFKDVDELWAINLQSKMWLRKAPLFMIYGLASGHRESTLGGLLE